MDTAPPENSPSFSTNTHFRTVADPPLKLMAPPTVAVTPSGENPPVKVMPSMTVSRVSSSHIRKARCGSSGVPSGLMITWPASFGLAEYLLHNQPLKGMKVLELGCGTAATGIALKLGGADVVCTDYDPLALTVARYNAGLNGCSSLSIRFLDWYKPDLEGSFDLVVGSEVVYFEKNFSPLLSVLKRYTATDGRIVLSDQLRPQMESFVKLCTEEGFACHQLKQMVYLPEQNQPVRITVLNSTPHPTPLP